jgi:BASS family bile acid:Na+ symporter
MARVRLYVENNLSLFLILSVIGGFLLPSFPFFTKETALVLVGTLIFLSCADIKRADFFNVDIYQVALFSFMRFAVFPIAVYYISRLFFPDLAIGMLLLAAMPAGVSVATLCLMNKGNVVTGLSITFISTLMAPFILTGMFAFLGHYIEIDILSLFLTLTGVVFLPIGLYAIAVRFYPPMTEKVRKNNKFLSVLIFSFVLMMVIASQKEAMIEDIDLMIEGLIALMILFGLFYLFGIFWSWRMPFKERVSYIYASGAVNNIIAIGLAYAYFSPVISLFAVMSELSWFFYIALAQQIFQRLEKKA